MIPVGKALKKLLAQKKAGKVPVMKGDLPEHVFPPEKKK